MAPRPPLRRSAEGLFRSMLIVGRAEDSQISGFVGAAKGEWLDVIDLQLLSRSALVAVGTHEGALLLVA